MDILYPHCAGLDVHKKTVVACQRSLTQGGQRRQTIETFGTTTAELLRLSDWLTAGDYVSTLFSWCGAKPVPLCAPAAT